MATPSELLTFSDAAYQGPDGNYNTLPAGWKVASQSDPNPNGYFGVAFENTQTGEIVVANRGSRASPEGLKQDWGGSDPIIAAQGGLGIPPAFNDANNFAQQVSEQFPGRPIQFTGHSLGGAEAQVQVATTPGSTGVTFGAPGAAFAVSDKSAEAASGSVVNYVLPGDMVGNTGTHIGTVALLSPSGTTLVKDTAVAAASVFGAALLGPLAAVLILAAGLTAASHPLGNYAAVLSQMVQSGGGGGGGEKPAARLTDMHVCPMVTGVVPHVGGPISGPCSPNVLIGSLPAARVTDQLVCVGPPDVIAMGSATVFINDLPAARLGDMTVHGGEIVEGHLITLIGG